MVIDLRSDTVTLPSDEMRKAIAEAELGDDVFGEDPTVNELERKTAELLGKEAALLVTSGTQGNLVCLLAQTRPGEEVIIDSEAHIYFYEQGGLSRVAGLIPRLISTDYGAITPSQLKAIIRPVDSHFAPTSLVCLENTHNRHGGAVLSQGEMDDLAETAHHLGLRIHLDGARIFNASVTLGVPVEDLVRNMDTVTFCLSKGLGCPIGSVVVGDEETIKKARRARKLLGGGLRQAGIIASAGLFALENMVDRLVEDHEHARQLIECFEEIKDIRVVKPSNGITTNIVLLDLSSSSISAPVVGKKLEEKGIKVLVRSETELRLVTHYGIERKHIEYVTKALKDTLIET